MASSREPLFLGLDFGANYTRICSARATEGRIERISHLDYYGTPSYPSSIARDVVHDHWLNGAAWENALVTQTSLQLFPDPRRALRTALNNQPDTYQETAAFEATRRLFFRLRGDVLETERATGSGGAALCVPLDTPNREKEALRAAITLPELAFISTPEAALLGYELAARLDERPRVVGVFDFGASGCRCTLLEVRQRQGLLSTQVLADYSNPNLGGTSLDHKVLRRLEDRNPAMKAALRELPAEDRSAAQEEALWQIRQLRVRLLENAEARGEAKLVRLNGLQLILDRQSLNNAIEDLTLSASQVLDSALTRAAITANSLHTLLPVGGLTRLGPIKNMLAMRVPQVETSPALVASSSDLLAPARGAVRFAAQHASESTGMRLVTLQSPAYGIALGGELDPILPANAPYPLRRSKIYASGAAIASGVQFEIWSGYGRGLEGATKIGDVHLEFKGEGWHFDEIPLRVSLELVKPGHLKVEVRSQDKNDPSQVLEVFRETTPGVWQTA